MTKKKKNPSLHVLHIASIKSTAGNKTRPFFSSFLISTSCLFILAKAFRNGYLVAFSTACRSDAEKNERDDYVTAPCLSKVTQHSSTADWIKFW